MTFRYGLSRFAPEEIHHARTRNYAASLGNDAIIVNLSGDAIPASETRLQELLAAFDDPTVGAAYGRQFPKPASTIEQHDTFEAIYGDQRIVTDSAHRNGIAFRFLPLLRCQLRTSPQHVGVNSLSGRLQNV